MTNLSDPGPKGFMRWLLQDWRVNRGYPDSQLVLLAFRLAQWCLRHGGFPGYVLSVAYRVATSLFWSVELPAQADVGPRLRLYHPHGVVLNPHVRLGADCILRQGVTIGNVVRRDGTERGVARAGDGVEFGAGCVVAGDIVIGDGARIGALALVLEDVPAGGVMVGSRAQLLRIDQVGGAAPGEPR